MKIFNFTKSKTIFSNEQDLDALVRRTVVLYFEDHV